MLWLDTNVAIGVISKRPEHLRERFRREAQNGPGVGISSITLFELHYGIARRTRPVQNAAALMQFLQAPVTVVPFGADDAEEAGLIRAELLRIGKPIGHYDILIAAPARRRRETLVTANTREFSRVAGLSIDDWSRA